MIARPFLLPLGPDRPGMREKFIKAVLANQSAFGLELDHRIFDRLADHYELVIAANPLLHLVAPCPPEQFATRHVLESLSMLKNLPRGAAFTDVGTGGGFPSIPCLLVRDDLKAQLIESKVKKASFLEFALERLGLDRRASVVNKQFEEASPGDHGYVICRALDKFTEKLPKLLKWSGRREMLFFGGNNLRKELEKRNIGFSADLLPMSERRFLFILETQKP